MGELTITQKKGLVCLRESLNNDDIKQSIVRALSKEIDRDKVLRIAETCAQKNPKLLECSTRSLIGCIVEAAQLDLMLDSNLGHAYPVPYSGEATLQIGYKGLLTLALRSGFVKDIYAACVYEDDEFDYQLGSTPKIKHKPKLGGDRDDGKIIAVYAVARTKEGGSVMDILPLSDIHKHRNHSHTWRKYKSGPWVEHFSAMSEKTAIRMLCKKLPMCQQLNRASRLDELGESGEPQRLADEHNIPNIDTGVVLDTTFETLESVQADEQKTLDMTE